MFVRIVFYCVRLFTYNDGILVFTGYPVAVKDETVHVNDIMRHWPVGILLYYDEMLTS